MQIKYINNIFLKNTQTESGIYYSLLNDLKKNHSNKDDLFNKIQIIVSNHGLAKWLKQELAKDFSICCNFDFVVLFNPVIEKIYLNNNQSKIFDFNALKFIFYDYFISVMDWSNDHFKAIIDFMNVNGQVSHVRAYQLASELAKIFEEYMYVRTEVIKDKRSLNKSKMPKWQKILWEYFLNIVKNKKEVTYLDIHNYFNKSNKFTSPKYLYLFAINNMYHQQITLIKNLAKCTNIYWYDLHFSYEYYGNLLSNSKIAYISKEIFKKDDFKEDVNRINDFFLIQGNPLIANLGIQRIYYNELLINNSIYDYNNYEESHCITETMLACIQSDIRNLYHRQVKTSRINDKSANYQDPVVLEDLDDSITINSCVNKMREVQVLFEETARLLHEKNYLLDDILIVAPNIDEYHSYIDAVFGNEYIANGNDKIYIPYSINKEEILLRTQILNLIEQLLTVPYHLPMSFLMKILKNSLIITTYDLSKEDFIEIERWILDNNTHFGFDINEYTAYNYDIDLYSFKRLINNIILGFFLPHNIYNDINLLPIYNSSNGTFVPYDNLEQSKLILANKLIKLIDLVSFVKNFIYINDKEYAFFSIVNTKNLIKIICDSILDAKNSNQQIEKDIILNIFNITLVNKINVFILKKILAEHKESNSSKVTINGKLLFTSIRQMRNVPFRAIFILGFNLGKFPRLSNVNKLSILSVERNIIDRNYNLEDKLTFLECILSAQEKLFISYCEDMGNINKPSLLLNILLDTIYDSFILKNKTTDESRNYLKNNLIHLHSRHPFNSKNGLYSSIWNEINKQCNFEKYIWDFSRVNNLNKSNIIEINVKNLSRFLLYDNYNLIKTLKVDTFNFDRVIEDYEEFSDLLSRNLANKLFKHFEKIDYSLLQEKYKNQELWNYLYSLGLLNTKEIGKFQLKHFFHLYEKYKSLCYSFNGGVKVAIELGIVVSELNNKFCLKDDFYVDNESLIIINDFTKTANKVSKELLFSSLILNLVINSYEISYYSGNKLYKIKNVKIKILDSNGEIITFQTSLLISNYFDTLKSLLRFYNFSLFNPVFIGKKNKLDNDGYKQLELLNIESYNDIINTFQYCDTEEVIDKFLKKVECIRV